MLKNNAIHWISPITPPSVIRPTWLTFPCLPFSISFQMGSVARIWTDEGVSRLLQLAGTPFAFKIDMITGYLPSWPFFSLCIRCYLFPGTFARTNQGAIDALSNQGGDHWQAWAADLNEAGVNNSRVTALQVQQKMAASRPRRWAGTLEYYHHLKPR